MAKDSHKLQCTQPPKKNTHSRCHEAPVGMKTIPPVWRQILGRFLKFHHFSVPIIFFSYDWTTQPAVHICFLSSWGWFATQSCCWQETHCWWILGVFYHVMVDILRCFISEISTLILATLGFSTLILFPNRPDFHAVWMIRIYHIWGWVKPYCYPF